VRENAATWTVGLDVKEIDLLVLSFLSRSSRTFRGVIILGESGFGEQCSMLARSLFEDMVDVHWAHAHADIATERMQGHLKYTRHLRIQSRERHPWVFRDAEKPAADDFTEAELAEARDLWGSAGTGSWTGENRLHVRVADIAHLWTTEKDLRWLRFMHGYANKIQNEVLHPSGLSIARIGLPTELNDGSHEWNLGSTRVLLAQALFSSLYSYTQTVGLVLQRYRPEQESALTQRWAEADRDFRQAKHWEDTNTLTPLPGSTAQNAPEPT
jgi:hypothetical protein